MSTLSPANSIFCSIMQNSGYSIIEIDRPLSGLFFVDFRSRANSGQVIGTITMTPGEVRIYLVPSFVFVTLTAVLFSSRRQLLR